jgi:hypothetical protein
MSSGHAPDAGGGVVAFAELVELALVVGRGADAIAEAGGTSGGGPGAGAGLAAHETTTTMTAGASARAASVLMSWHRLPEIVRCARSSRYAFANCARA